jgi:putative acetyltransferase
MIHVSGSVERLVANRDSHSAIVVRPGGPDDAEAIWRVHVASIRQVCTSHYMPEQIEAWAGPKRPGDYVRVMSNGERFWVAVDDGDIVGFASLHGDTIYGLYVAPGMQRQGIGAALLRAAEAGAADAGVETLKLGATLNAEAFYRAQGYVSDGRTSRIMKGVEVPSIRMSKLLRPG